MQKKPRDLDHAGWKQQALTGFLHDSLAFGYGAGLVKVLFWKFLGKISTLRFWYMPQ